MKITKIDQQVKAKGRYSIFVDDKFAFGISETGLINSGLRSGQELTALELDDLKSDAATDKIFQQVLSLIMRRPRSLWEVKNYLKRKGVEDETSEEVINRLAEKGFIDDLDFATRWVDNRRLLKNISRRKLELELRQKRVEDSVIKQVLAEDVTEDFEVLKKEIEKKRSQSRYQDDTKLMQYLARQGYRYDDIKRALTG